MQQTCARYLAAAVLIVGLGQVLAPPARATDLPDPSGPVVLTVEGSIARTNGPGTARFDLAMLESLGRTEFLTSTIWTEGPTRFEGVLLSVVLAHLGASGTEVLATAVNEYRVGIPLSEVTSEAPLVAYRRDGVPMSLRDKGPLWIVYPYDSDPEYRTEKIFARSIWQLEYLSVR